MKIIDANGESLKVEHIRKALRGERLALLISSVEQAVVYENLGIIVSDVIASDTYGELTRHTVRSLAGIPWIVRTDVALDRIDFYGSPLSTPLVSIVNLKVP